MSVLNLTELLFKLVKKKNVFLLFKQSFILLFFRVPEEPKPNPLSALYVFNLISGMTWTWKLLKNKNKKSVALEVLMNFFANMLPSCDPFLLAFFFPLCSDIWCDLRSSNALLINPNVDFKSQTKDLKDCNGWECGYVMNVCHTLLLFVLETGTFLKNHQLFSFFFFPFFFSLISLWATVNFKPQ